VSRSAFAALFGRPAAAAAEAPGRVNLIGEHTDYNGGLVLPVAIPQRTRVEVAPRPDRTVQAASATLGGEVVRYRLGAEAPGHGWLDYLQGVTHVLAAEGHAIGGFDARIESAVPVGAGLASSAALEVALLRALRAAFALDLDDVAIARLGQRGEHAVVGSGCGIMDQMAASLGGEGHALFLDTQTLHRELVPLPRGAELVVISSGVAHAHAHGDYGTRRRECERACALLGIASLRAAGEDAPGRLPEPLARRVRHVISENRRVLAAVEAMRRGDLARLGRLFNASHASLRDDYEVSIPETDLLVELAQACGQVYGARLTGGGFGGSVVALAEEATGRAVAERVALGYAARAGREATVLLPVG
jgi:galactokinase